MSSNDNLNSYDTSDDKSNALPLFTMRDTVLFPGMVAPLSIGRTTSVRTLSALGSNPSYKEALFTAQSNPDEDEPTVRNLYKVGVKGKIIQLLKLNNNYKILIEVSDRVELFVNQSKDFFSAKYQVISDEPFDEDSSVLDKVMTRTIALYNQYINLNTRMNPELLVRISSSTNNQSHIINALASHMTCKLSKKQALLEIKSVKKRAEKLCSILVEEIALMETEKLVQSETKKQVEKTQRNYYLNEQMKVIQKVLGNDGEKSDTAELQRKIRSLKLTKEAREKAEGELKKLKLMNPMAAEASVIRNYLETLLGMPWGKYDNSAIDIKKAAAVLDRDHYGLEKVKERILEYIAVLYRTKKCQGPILCLVGPPGVGKTSLVKSIAEAIGRKYMKFALGGVRDEAEVRGHRRTYIGAMPGKIISLMKQAKRDNPVILLDEIDKTAADFRGDPASALLEVLDPEQNKHFVDHYLEVAYDLSSVTFIATANQLPSDKGPLFDRMEVIDIGGYVESEKLQIAKQHLLSKQIKLNGLKTKEFNITDDAIISIIRYYTREAGVRALERRIGSLARKAVRKILTKSTKSITINSDNLNEYLGIPKYKYGLVEETDKVGITTGLAYTKVGGDLLYIEAVTIPGKGEIKTTGKLGDVMKESIHTAYSYLCSRTDKYNIKEELKKLDIHIHVPEGGVPKDGPSAGITIFTTMVSLLTGVSVKKSVAMTGEITLRGRILPIGGLKEKLLAAKRGGIETVVIPEDNMRDLEEVPESIKGGLKIIPIVEADQVLSVALTGPVN